MSLLVEFLFLASVLLDLLHSDSLTLNFLRFLV